VAGAKQPSSSAARSKALEKSFESLQLTKELDSKVKVIKGLREENR